MIKNKIKIFMAVIASIICMGAGMIIGTQSNAAVKNNPNSNVKGWNISAPETTRAPGSAFTYNVYPSTDKKSAWIYHIDVDPNMDYSTLNIPQTINGMTVTRLGWVYVPSKNDDFLDTDEFNQTIFGAIVEQCHGASGSYIPLGDNLRNRTYISMSVSSITIPNTVTQLQESTFSGIVNLREITIPDGVSVIPAELFYGCSSLESVKLPKALNSIDPSATALRPQGTAKAETGRNASRRQGTVRGVSPTRGTFFRAGRPTGIHEKNRAAHPAARERRPGAASKRAPLPGPATAWSGHGAGILWPIPYIRLSCRFRSRRTAGATRDSRHQDPHGTKPAPSPALRKARKGLPMREATGCSRFPLQHNRLRGIAGQSNRS